MNTVHKTIKIFVWANDPEGEGGWKSKKNYHVVNRQPQINGVRCENDL